MQGLMIEEVRGELRVVSIGWDLRGAWVGVLSVEVFCGLRD